MMRDSRLDYIRTLAILMVITVHTWSIAKIDAYPLMNGAYHAFEDCGVPLFLMLSGALTLSAPIPSIRAFYAKRLKRVLLPFLGWSLLVYVLSVALHRYPEVTSLSDALLQYVPFLLTNRINYAYWFVPLIVVLYLLTPLLRPAIETIGRSGVRCLLLMWIPLVVLQNHFPDIYFLRYTSALVPYLGYYLAGYYIYRYHPQPSRRLLLLAGGLILVGCCGVVMGWPLGELWGMLERTALFPLLLAIRLPESRFFRFCSNGSYSVYLIHFLFITPIYSLLHFSAAAPWWQCLLIPAATTVLVACISYCVVGPLQGAKRLMMSRKR